MKKEFLMYIYEQTISIVLKDIPKESQLNIAKAYQEYLIRTYKHVNVTEESISKLKETFLKMELSCWENKTLNQKMSMLLVDEYFDKLFYLSDLTKEQVNAYLIKMEEYFNKVASYNRKIAKDYLSEASLDFMYAIGESDDKSFRIAH